ncbi:aminotransferase class I/II-fold pyridoxal phosphate-dependent enzyme [Candidatus Neomarinimicrobiota bacterium]
MKISNFKLERFFAKYEFAVEYLLCSSDCESLPIDELFSMEPDASNKFNKFHLGYTESKGNPTLRYEISKIYNSIESNQILVHSGAQEAIFLFMHAMLNREDHVIIHHPCYQSLIEVPRNIGCQISHWPAKEKDGWSLSINELEAMIQPNTKVIVVNIPHNPTGYLMDQDDFIKLNQISKENDIILFSDEVYRESEYSIEDQLPAVCDINDNSVSLGVMSKSYGLAGLRIGWIATKNPNIYSKMMVLKDYTTICNSGPSEFLAELALRNRLMILKRNKKIIKNNLAILNHFFEHHLDKFVWKRPKAGPIAFPRLIENDVEQFCIDVLEKTDVLLLPGTVYDDNGNHFRIGFGRRNMPMAVERLDNYLSTIF